MRGCLTFLVLVAVIVAIAGWFLLPAAAAFVIRDRLNTAGFVGADTVVSVESDPPLSIATLHADLIHVTSSDVHVGGLVIGRVDATASDVNLLDRTAGDLTGLLSDVRFESGLGTTWSVSSAQLSGTSESPRVTLNLTAEDARAMASSAIEKRFGSVPSDVAFAAPDRISFVANGTAAGGRLIVDEEGRLLFAPGGAAGSLIGQIDLLVPGSDVPLRVRSAEVTPDGITLSGSIDTRLISP